MTTYDDNFTAMTEAEFLESVAPLVEDYRATFGKSRQTVEDARNALLAHCNAWAINKARRKVTARVMERAIE